MDNKDTKKNKKVKNKENSEKTETKTKIEFPSFFDYLSNYQIIFPISSSSEEQQILKSTITGRFENIKIKENEIISILKSTFQLAKSNFNPAYYEFNLNSIVKELDNNLHYIYEIPDTKLLFNKLADYRNFTYSYEQLLINSNLFLENFKTFFERLNKVFNFWYEVVLYHKNNTSYSGKPHFNNPIFNFDIELIDRFFKVITKEHIEDYLHWIKRQFAITQTNIDTINFDFRLNYIFDYHNKYKLNIKFIHFHQIAEFTFNTLRKLGLQNSYEEFEQFFDNRKKVTLIISTRELERKTFVYELAFILEKLRQKELLLLNKKSFTLAFDNKRYTYGEIIDTLDKNLRKKGIDYRDDNIEVRSQECNDWYHYITEVTYYRPYFTF